MPAQPTRSTIPAAPVADQLFRRAVIFVALANLAYFFVEFAVAVDIGSVSLFADSVDFLEDASVNLLISVALGWSLKQRGRVGMLLTGLLLIPAIATVLTGWNKISTPFPPEPTTLTATGAGALVVNLICAFVLAEHRAQGGSLAKAAFLSARNDALANVAIMGAGLVTAHTSSGWPDLIAGIAIAAMNVDAARAVWQAAKAEHVAAHA